MRELIRNVLKNQGYLAKGWEVTQTGDLRCPCGHKIEQDGKCPEGHKSPLLKLGLI